MLESRRTAVALDEEELIELQRIIIDHDEEGALKFLKRAVYNKVAKSQSGRLKCHLDTGSESPVERFKKSK